MSATPPAHILALAREREDVDAETARELMGEAAILLHNGLALDGLDEHDPDLHDPTGVRAAYLVSASVLQL